MSLFLVLLAAGDGKRLKSKVPKPYNKINNKTLLEYSLDAFGDISKIKKILVVYNKKHTKYLKKLELKKTIKIVGGKTRQESTFKALEKIKKMNCKKEALITLNQKHSNHVVFFDTPNSIKNKLSGDAIVTKITNVGIGILTADCIPILLYDPKNNIIGCIHSGWKGAYKKIGVKMVNLDELIVKTFI